MKVKVDIKKLFGSDKVNKDDTQKGEAVFFDANLLFIPERCIDGKDVFRYAYCNELVNDFVERAKGLGVTCSADDIKKAGGINDTNSKDKGTENFKELCNDDNLPIIARNCLDNGESVNLWYEQVVPSKSVFATMIMTPNGELDLLHNQIVQIGAHASIGYGYCKMVKLNKEA